tara:strand:+ start:1822 stop:2088 length:267 start_codon:yes stop_codon:yes gene_type:complete
MFILTTSKTGGVYAVQADGEGKKLKTVHVFEQRDDALRYKELLTATDYKDKLDIMDVDVNIIALNCDKYGYHYTIVRPNDLVIPPSDT